MKHPFAVAIRFATLLFALLAMPPARAEDSVRSVLDCMRANLPPAVRVQDIQLTSFDHDVENRVMKGKLVVTSDKGLVRARLRISAPPDLSGAAYLLREAPAGSEDQMFVYLPSLARVRRITGAGAEGSLLGTDLSFNDVKDIENAFDGNDAGSKLEPDAQLDDRAVWVLAMTPRAGQASRYTSARAWVDHKTCVALKVEFYRNGEALKELRAPAASLLQTEKYWYASTIDVRDLKAGTRTSLRVVGVSSGNSVPGSYFNPQSFNLDN